jgi:hypothetical protein
MPNWCNNSVVFNHENPEMIARINRVIDGDTNFFNEFVVMPEELMNTDKGFFSDDDKQEAMEKANNRNLKKYGYKDWYDFAVGEWGTKWDVAGCDLQVFDSGPNHIGISFDTAWNPPIEFFRKMEDSHGYIVDAEYSETGCCYVGTYSNGHDQTYSYNCKKDLENIPSDLVEGFCLEEMFDEYEAQEVDDASWRA